MIAPVENTKNSPSKPQIQNFDKELQNPIIDREAQLAAYQYANLLNSNAPFTLVGAAISPAIIPVSYYSGQNQEIQKPAKKKKPSNKSGSSSSKKPPKDTDRQVNIAHITISPATPHPHVVKQVSSNPSYSPNQIAANEQAAYFNYLNTYSPNQNYPNQAFNGGANHYGFLSQYPQSNGQSNQFNPYNNPLGAQNAYGFQNQGAPNFPYTPNALLNPYTPFNGYPSFPFNGNIPPQHISNPLSNSLSVAKPSASVVENSSPLQIKETTETIETTEAPQEDSNKREPRE